MPVKSNVVKIDYKRVADIYPEELKSRLFSSRVITPDGHWIWLGSLDADGYGQISIENRQHKVHILSVAIFKDIDPIGQNTLHLPPCVRRDCFNPEHLYLGDAKQNTSDMMSLERGRHQQKTHCPQGHPYFGDNLYICKTPTGFGRKCRACYIANRKKNRS